MFKATSTVNLSAKSRARCQRKSSASMAAATARMGSGCKFSRASGRPVSSSITPCAIGDLVMPIPDLITWGGRIEHAVWLMLIAAGRRSPAHRVLAAGLRPLLTEKRTSKKQPDATSPRQRLRGQFGPPFGGRVGFDVQQVLVDRLGVAMPRHPANPQAVTRDPYASRICARTPRERRAGPRNRGQGSRRRSRSLKDRSRTSPSPPTAAMPTPMLRRASSDFCAEILAAH